MRRSKPFSYDNIDNLRAMLYDIGNAKDIEGIKMNNQTEITKRNALRWGCMAMAALLMLGTLLAGCDKQTDEQTPAQSTEATTAEQTSAEQTTAETTDEITTQEESTMQETTEQNVADQIPEDGDYYKNPTKLYNKSIMFCANEFKGEFQSVEFKNHGLTLVEGASEGYFISEEVDMGGSFKNMLASWNTSSSGGTVEVSVSVKLDDGSFTCWYSWGEWSAIPETAGSKSNQDDYGKVGIDILTLKKECAGIVKYRIDIKKTVGEAPTVYNVTLACDKQTGALTAPAQTYMKLDVPYRRQMDVPEIGGSICSATSLSMVMLYHGEQIDDIADIAWGVRDWGEQIFGNWAFNVAYAGELGYQSYIDYYDIDAIKYAISTGHPIVSSIRVKAGQLAASGHPNYTTNGHLLCVVGFEEKNGQKWLLINDPAHPEVTAILESDFANIYRGVSYIVQTRPAH